MAARAPDICRPTRRRALDSLLLNAAQRRRRHDPGAWLSTHLLEEILPAVDSPLGGSCRKTGGGGGEKETKLIYKKKERAVFDFCEIHRSCNAAKLHTDYPVSCETLKCLRPELGDYGRSPRLHVLSLASAADAARSQARSRNAAESFSIISEIGRSFRATN